MKPKTSPFFPLSPFLLLACSLLASADGIVPRRLTWLEGNGASPVMGTTLGVPWPMGALATNQPLALAAEDGSRVASQTWPLAYWPDGSVKWTAVAMGPRDTPSATFTLASADAGAEQTGGLTVTEDAQGFVIDTGAIQARVAASGTALVPVVRRGDRTILENGRLVALNQDQPSDVPSASVVAASFESRVDQVVVEQRGPVRAVVRVEGRHVGGDRAFLPFVVRLYFYAGSDNIRMVHTFVYDADEHKDFIRGIGIRFDVPLTDPLHDRHIRFSDAEGGLWREAVRGVTGLRRDPGEAVRRAQVEGQALPDPATWDQRVTGRLKYIPAWNDYTLVQLAADGYEIRKRTGAGHGWIRSAGGARASGMVYVGGASGGVAFGMKDFWQSHPSQLDVRNAASDKAETTLWLWAPDARPMDLRFYHDGLGMKTLEDEREGGLAITYEDYKEGNGTPYGVARTSELNFWVTASTPSGTALLAFAKDAMNPPLLATDPAQILEVGVFGGLWTLPDRSTPTLARIEDALDAAFAGYVKQREIHRWYGFWDYGDVMHSFDGDRNAWRYDVGGYAWDNSELSPDIWLWTLFLRSGRADVFRFAEAMVRHTGEVDVYHLGSRALLGSRHHVQHWGDGMKQLRISTPAYRRYFYYLTADERTGDLLRAQLDAYKTYLTYNWFDKTPRGDEEKIDPRAMSMGAGMDMGIIGMGWLVEWERTQEPRFRDRLVNMMTSLGKLPFGFYSVDTQVDIETGVLTTRTPDKHVESLSHLNMVFGYPEFAAELLQLFDVPGYRQAWLNYARHYNSGRDERREAIGVDIARKGNLRAYYSRLTGFAAYLTGDADLARRAWREILGDDDQPSGPFRHVPARVEGAESLHAFDRVPFTSTNWAAEWNNAMLQNLHYIGKYLEADDPRTRPVAADATHD